MRLSDAPTAEAEIEIGAPAERVWQIVTDLQTPALSSPEFRGAEWLDGATGPAVGARFRGRNQHEAIGEWETVAEVVVADEPRELAYAIGGVGGPADDDAADDPGAVWRYLIEPAGEGSVRLRQVAQIGPGRSGLSLAIDRWPDKEERIVARRLDEHRRSMQANLAKIKELAEGTGGS